MSLFDAADPVRIADVARIIKTVGTDPIMNYRDSYLASIEYLLPAPLDTFTAQNAVEWLNIPNFKLWLLGHIQSSPAPTPQKPARSSLPSVAMEAPLPALSFDDIDFAPEAASVVVSGPKDQDSTTAPTGRQSLVPTQAAVIEISDNEGSLNVQHAARAAIKKRKMSSVVNKEYQDAVIEISDDESIQVLKNNASKSRQPHKKVKLERTSEVSTRDAQIVITRQQKVDEIVDLTTLPDCAWTVALRLERYVASANGRAR